MAYIVTACVVKVYILMAYIVMAYIVMAYTQDRMTPMPNICPRCSTHSSPIFDALPYSSQR